MTWSTKAASFLTLGVLGALSTPQAALACAMCGLSPGDHAIRAYNASVLFMLSTPYALVLGGGLLFYCAWRSAQRKSKAQGKPASVALWRRGLGAMGLGGARANLGPGGRGDRR